MTITLARQLEERLNKDLDGFKAYIMEFGKESIYRMASEIAAVEDAYWQLMTQTDFDNDDAEFFLKFKYPLLIIAEMWASHQGEQGVDYDGLLYEFFDDENLGKYPLVSATGVDVTEKHSRTEVTQHGNAGAKTAATKKAPRGG